MGFFDRLSRFGRLSLDRGLRPEKRASTLVSMANSLALIARGIAVIVEREYKIDLNAPAPSRREQTVEVWEPEYANNIVEAIREERERIEAAELDLASTGDGRRDAERSAHVREPRLSYLAAEGESDQLTPEEQRFLGELDTPDDER